MTQKASLLIVDDEVAQMTALCATLEDEGYAPTGFTSSRQALAALAERKFDVVLTDLMMPEMDGIAFLHAAQKLDRDLVGIVMTGHGAIDTAIAAMKAGALDYILKPFKLSAIVPAISRALAVRRLRMENAGLQELVRAHTAQLEAANTELEAFCYSVSHDLRAPLRAIHGFSELLREGYAPQLPLEAQQLLRQVTAGAQRMAQIIDDLLRFSHLTRQPLSKGSVNMSALVHEVLAELVNEQGHRQIQVHVDALPDATGDPGLLKQVFANLLSNAIKFTRKRERPIICVGAQQQGREEVYFVQDNGVGFDMRHAERLFGPFQRLHGDEAFEGTGVGLSLAQRIIQRHGGRMWAEAKVDNGATFFFSLPN